MIVLWIIQHLQQQYCVNYVEGIESILHVPNIHWYCVDVATILDVYYSNSTHVNGIYWGYSMGNKTGNFICHIAFDTAFILLVTILKLFAMIITKVMILYFSKWKLFVKPCILWVRWKWAGVAWVSGKNQMCAYHIKQIIIYPLYTKTILSTIYL